MKKLTILSLAILATSANAFRGDWQADSDGGGGAFIVGIILIVAAFNYFRDDELFGVLSSYIHFALFSLGLFFIGVTTWEVAIPIAIAFCLAVHFFPHKNKSLEGSTNSRYTENDMQKSHVMAEYKSRSSFDSNIGLDKKINQHPLIENWYKTESGIGNKTSAEFYSKKEYVYSSLEPSGYWVSLEKASAKQLFIFHKGMETVGIDSNRNKFLTICPKCKVSCLGDIFEWVLIDCPKCGCKWEQKIK